MLLKKPEVLKSWAASPLQLMLMFTLSGCVLTGLDGRLEGGASGLDAVIVLRDKYPDMKIIVMSGFDEITYAPRAKEAGADAFIFKSKSLDYFIEIINGVMQGKNYYPEKKIIPMPAGEAPLTEREIEVLRLMCRHMTSGIARSCLSVRIL